ncbi:TPA: hypothetical protein EYN98_29710 [Candidatus Poribacteria bacterium]|nr:hypothetical protein [Candidatus Poribacteria bacterium]HIN28905.1 hypothetical protein [Candidatus Poribacteria bacterium]HIO05688.1 hypothetical protein [Candidatus Poribacteria bacterium]HIO79703.1 hypothetical protein [Candidatus Poribacteria bacterium]
MVRMLEIGTTPCGELDKIEAGPVVSEHWLPSILIGKSKFIIRARRNSMAPDMCHNGLLLVDPAHEVNNDDFSSCKLMTKLLLWE